MLIPPLFNISEHVRARNHTAVYRNLSPSNCSSTSPEKYTEQQAHDTPRTQQNQA